MGPVKILRAHWFCSVLLLACSKTEAPPQGAPATAASGDTPKKPKHAAASASSGVAAPSASVAVADAGMPTLTNDPAARHLTGTDGPYATLDDACKHLLVTCAANPGGPACKCDPGPVVITSSGQKSPFLDAATLTVHGTDTVFPAFRLAGGWFIAPADGLSFSDGDASMGGQTHWRTIKVTSARIEDLHPGGDPELILRFASQQDSAYSGSMGGGAKPRSTDDENELALMCTTAFAKPACLGPIEGPPAYKDGAKMKVDPADLGDTKHLVFP